MSFESFPRIMRPHPVEADYEVSQIEGEVPRELNGTLYRNCPNQKILPKGGPGALHLFDGDGMVSAIRFDEGRVRYRGRYARTPSFLREQAEGEFCLGTIGVPPERALSDTPPNHQNNTNAVFHAGRLFAMVENAPPFELDPDTLASMGPWDYDGRMLGGSTSAHPRIDGKTGQMINHGYQAFSPSLTLYTVEPDGSVSLAEAIEPPWAGMLHDIAITENYVIIPLGAIDFDESRVRADDPLSALRSLRARPDLNLRFGIRRREPGSATRWFETSSSHYIFHLGNAFERDGRIYLDGCTYENPGAILGNLPMMRDGRGGPGGESYPYLYEFDLQAGTCKETKLSDEGAELPRLDDRRIGYENRVGYASIGAGFGPEGVFRRVIKYSRTGGPSVVQPAVEDHWVSEPVFVPRSPDAEEDDGFVLALRFDAVEDRTGIDILDARGIDAEPLARLWLEERVPFSFHGNWVNADVSSS